MTAYFPSITINLPVSEHLGPLENSTQGLFSALQCLLSMLFKQLSRYLCLWPGMRGC